MMRWFCVFVMALTAHPVPAQENQQMTCTAVLGDMPAAAECQKVFAKDADCCIQYDAERLAKQCAKMSSIENALTCFSEIHEVGFWKTELRSENEPGLAEKFSMQWKKNVMRECVKEKTKGDALDCAVLHKSGTLYVYGEKNAEIARQSAAADPIMKFCRETFGDYWEGVERCVAKQKAAKKRLGQ
jgi:hypothetical protein